MSDLYNQPGLTKTLVIMQLKASIDAQRPNIEALQRRLDTSTKPVHVSEVEELLDYVLWLEDVTSHLVGRILGDE